MYGHTQSDYLPQSRVRSMVQIAGNWTDSWNRKRHETERRNGTFGFRCYTSLYAIEAPDVSRIKFGVTSNVEKRYRQLCNGCPVPLTLLGHVWMPNEFEGAVFSFLEGDRIHGEWFIKTERSRAIAALIAAKKDRDLADVLGLLYMIPTELVPGGHGFYVPKE